MHRVKYLCTLIGLLATQASAADKIPLFNQVESAKRIFDLEQVRSQQVSSKPVVALTKLQNHRVSTGSDTQNYQFNVLNEQSIDAQTILTVQQSYNGLPIWGHELVLLLDSRKQLEQAYGSLVEGLKADLPEFRLASNDKLAQMQAQFIATFYQDNERVFRNETVSQVIFIDESNVAHHAAMIQFFTDVVSDKSHPEKVIAFVDISNGKLLSKFDGLHRFDVEGGSGPSGNAKVARDDYQQSGYAAYPPTTFVVRLEAEGQGSNCYFDAKNVETRNYAHNINAVTTPYRYDCTTSTRNDFQPFHSANNPLNDAHFHAQTASLMYEAYLGHKPYFDQKIVQNVHYGINMDQAFYENGQIYLGDGDFLFYPMVALDVVAHEISHGFTEEFGTSTPKSMLTGQARAINEAFSDMAGEAAEYFLKGTNDWLSNTEAYRLDEALRYFAEPKKDGASIDHVDDYDNSISAHHGAGVFNRAFHFLATNKMGEVESPWTTKYAFILFANANKYCWTANSTYESAADCAFRQASSIATLLTNDGVKKADGSSWKTFELKNHIRKAFAQVGISLDVNKGVEAEFGYDRRFLAYQFKNLTNFDGNVVEGSSDATNWQWHWDFGHDGATSNAIAPTHTFPAAGVYTVTLTATSPQGVSDLYQLNVTVNDSYCTANGVNHDKYFISKVTLNGTEKASGSTGYSDFSANPVILQDGNKLNVTIDAGSHADTQDKTKNFYVWLDKNDDGLFDKNSELVLSGSNKTTFTGSLSLTGELDKVYRLRTAVSFGLLKQACGDISWGEIEDYSVHLIENTTPVTLSIQEAMGVNLVSFTNNTIDARIEHWRWSFGDGVQSSDKSPTHEYSRSGAYEVVLRALDKHSNELARWSKTVNFQTQITPRFEYSVTGKTLSVNAMSSVMPKGSTVYWEFGDGFTSTQIQTSHTYVEERAYNVTLTVRHDDGDKQTSKEITLGEGTFKPQLTHTVKKLDNGQYEVAFINDTQKPSDLSSSYKLIKLIWNFGDGSPVQEVSSYDFGKDNVHVYDAGSFTPSLEIKYYNKNWDYVSGTTSLQLELKPDEPIAYCQASGFTEYEHIKNVTFNQDGPFTNSELSGVVNPNNPIRLYVGQNNTYRIEADYAGSDKFAENYHVWIDLNQNGQFGDGDWRNDKSELIIADFDNTTQDFGNGFVQGTFQLPANLIKTGTTRTRMRILQYYDFSRINSIDPCSDYSSSATPGSGEIEDYLVEIIKN
ncbi:PKD domain-containing protein [Pseudoalteromonas xiamenensis]|uniref:PKD domain-containing protein n=1 Tax=Pseudoalteromonas xiamenensis TaxID=882626 RepID=UPI0035EF1787